MEQRMEKVGVNVEGWKWKGGRGSKGRKWKIGRRRMWKGGSGGAEEGVKERKWMGGGGSGRVEVEGWKRE